MFARPQYLAFLNTSHDDIEQAIWSINASIEDDELEACLEADN